MKVTRIALVALTCITVAVVAASYSYRTPAAGPQVGTPEATPIGITIEFMRQAVVLKNGLFVREPPQGRMYADVNGRSLYVFEGDLRSDRPTCTAGCGATWKPAIAMPPAKAILGWSIAIRANGARQWEYHGRPLYTYVGDESAGDTKGDGIDGKWHLVRPDLETQTAAMPPGAMIVSRVAGADSPTLADANGMTLYFYDGDGSDARSVCNAECITAWRPLRAAELARPLGDWSIREREDGTKEWLYRDRPVYTYRGDIRPGDNNGESHAGWHAAALVHSFTPSGVAVGTTNKGWSVLTTGSGMTLYLRDRYQSDLSHSLNEGPPLSSEVGRSIGTAGCTGECLNMWHPLTAPGTAVSTGYWSVVGRPDGTSQWAYKGYPLYTYVRDEQPGDSFGHDIFEYTDGANALYWRVATP